MGVQCSAENNPTNRNQYMDAYSDAWIVDADSVTASLGKQSVDTVSVFRN